MRRGYLTPPVLIILALITFGVALTLFLNTNLLKNIKNQPTPSPAINSFVDCARAGNRILLTYPRQCKTPDGKSFTEVINQESLDIAPCDVNSDGMCNVADLNLLNTALGTSRGQKNYHPLADLDADGVINDTDKQILLKLIEQNQSDETANWKTYTSQDNSYSFKYPTSWKQKSIQIFGSRSVQEIEDPQGAYLLSFINQGNYNNNTGKPFADLYDFEQLPYTIKTVRVNGQEGIQPLPRAGSEHITAVDLFSKDFKRILILELETQSRDEKEILKGQEIFDQILSTFRFE